MPPESDDITGGAAPLHGAKSGMTAVRLVEMRVDELRKGFMHRPDCLNRGASALGHLSENQIWR
jgi:hypothetical protein